MTLRTGLALFAFGTALSGSTFGQSTGPFVRGGDPSEIPEVEATGGRYYDQGAHGDPLVIMHSHGLNLIRLRVWVNPTMNGIGTVSFAGYCDTAHTLAMAKRAFQAGLQVAIDFHYSDWWADPGKQWPPAAWANLDHAQLVAEVYQYTKSVIGALVAQHTPPAIVQPGNEVTNGILWPDGYIDGSAQQWQNFTDLLKAAIKGVHDAEGPNKIKIMIHTDKGGDNAGATYFYENILKYGVKFDIIGLSYYKWWHGPLTNLESNLPALAIRFGKPIIVAETGYPFTFSFSGHPWSHSVTSYSDLVPGFDATPDGQAAYLKRLVEIVQATPRGLGMGVLYWAPAWISTPGEENNWENNALFDYNWEALPGLDALGGHQSAVPPRR
jgi:arabinogalactan endo-1,4-beta-galactosidase